MANSFTIDKRWLELLEWYFSMTIISLWIIYKIFWKTITKSVESINTWCTCTRARIVNFGKIARKQHLYDLCLETLNKIHKNPSVPIIDCFLKVKQEIKCYIKTYEYLSPKQSKDTNFRFLKYRINFVKGSIFTIE